ncbi:hypothetical protein Bbelb_177100 [Branchiostoma belcheri]|nr:hypothetical protein Bbelb_177100 [Branchiostoma belcheri]
MWSPGLSGREKNCSEPAPHIDGPAPFRAYRRGGRARRVLTLPEPPHTPDIFLTHRCVSTGDTSDSPRETRHGRKRAGLKRLLLKTTNEWQVCIAGLLSGWASGPDERRPEHMVYVTGTHNAPFRRRDWGRRCRKLAARFSLISPLSRLLFHVITNSHTCLTNRRETCPPLRVRCSFAFP